jgi:hypothetical protein
MEFQILQIIPDLGLIPKIPKNFRLFVFPARKIRISHVTERIEGVKVVYQKIYILMLTSSAAASDGGAADSWRRVVERLFISPFCEEFRRPVRVLHPDLTAEYRLVVQEPMDLGSVLYKIARGDYQSPYQCSADIALIFKNSIQFNEGSIEMTSISSHLLQYARNLWEEIVQLPFDETSALQGGQAFRAQRYRHRAQRYALVRDAPLCLGEINDIIEACEQPMTAECAQLSTIITEQMALLKQHGLREQRRQDMRARSVFGSSGGVGGGEAMDAEDEADGDSNDSMTLSQVLIPVAEYVLGLLQSSPQLQTGKGDSVGVDCPCISEEVRAVLSKRNDPTSPPLSTLPREALAYVRELDERLGEAIVHIFERRTRGYILSAVWARPHRFVWAQPTKSPWWPGMVIAGDGVPDVLSEINLSRLPPGIVKALEKLRPRVASKTEGAGGAGDDTHTAARAGRSGASTISIPPNYCLVEFFGGAHDFGWVKAGFMTDFLPDVPFKAPMGPDGQPIMQQSVAAGGSRRDATKCTTDSKAIREATDAPGSIDASTAFPNDFIDIPSFEDLEIDFLTPEPEAQQVAEVAEQPAPSSASKPKRSTSKTPQSKTTAGIPGGSEADESGTNVRSSGKKKPVAILPADEDVREALPPSVLRKRRSMQQAHFLAIYLRSHDPCGDISCPQSMDPPPALTGIVPPGLPGHDPVAYRETVATIERAAAGLADPEEAQKVACYRYFDIDNGGAAASSKPASHSAKKAAAKRSVETSQDSTESAPVSKKSKVSIGSSTKVEAIDVEDASVAGTAVSSDQQGGAAAADKEPNPKQMRMNWRNMTALRVASEGTLKNPYRTFVQRNYNGSLSVLGYELKNSCVRFLFGEGVCQTRIVDETADIFFLESKSSAVRKRLMQAEIDRLHREVDKIMSSVGTFTAGAQRGKPDSLQSIAAKKVK